MKADDYKKLGFYESKTTNISNSFGKFSDENEHYFCYNSDKGYAILISEAYSSESGRDNGIKSVQKNMTNPDRYVRQTTDAGKHYFSLRAGNNQEIAMSRQFGSTGEMNQAIGKLTGEGGVIAAAGAVDTDNITAAGEGYTANFSIAAPAPTPTDEEDKPKKKRKKKTGPKKPKPERVELKKGKYLFNDVTYKTFRSGEDKHYFMFNDSNDKMLFMTTNLKGFPTEKQVDEALAKAIELAPSEANYEGKVAKNGTYYFYLKDADGKNFGKSFFYKQEEDMRQAVGLLIGRVAGAGAPADVVDADAGAKAAAAAETARLKAEADAKAKADADAKRKADETARLKAEADAKAKADADAKRKADETARLKAEADAKAKADADAKRKADEAARLKAEADAKAKADADAKRKADEAARLKAEADAKAKAEAEAKRKADEAARLKAEADAKAKADAEAARLKAEQQKKAAAAAAAAAAATALALKQKSDAAAKEEKERKALRSDDYLPCKEYGGKTGFNKFHNAERNQHYFAYNDRNGNTLLRSEGYTTEAARDNGLRSVIKNSPSDQNWKTEVALGKYHYYVLRAGNNQEIARSCYYESKDEMMAAYNGVTGENSAIGIGSALVGGKLLSAAMLRRRSQEEEADAKRKANEAARLKAEADAKAKADAEAARLKAEAEDKRKAEEAARLKAEADAKAKADAEAARLKAEAEAKRKANEAARLKAEQDKKAAAAAAAAAAASALAFRQKEEANAKAKAEQARLRAEADAKRKAEADAKAKADAEAARLKAEAEAKRKADETARLKAEQDKKAAAAASALAFRQKEEANAKAKAEQARLRAEADAKRKAEAETKRKADEAARLKSDQDRKAAAAAAATAAAAAAASALALRRKEEVNAKAEEARLKTEAKAKAEADAARLKAEAKAEAIRLRTEETPGKAKIEATAKPKSERVVATAAAASTGGGTSKKVSATTPVDDGAGLGGCLRKWWWLALLLLLLPLLFFLIRGCGGAVAACDVPDVRIQGTNNTTVQLATANIAADISNVDKENINVTFNNKPIDNFTYNEDNDKFGINLALISGKNTLRINAKNECGEDTETRTITYQEKSTFIGKNCTDLGFNKNSLSCNMANYMAAGASTFPKMFTFDRSRFGQNSAKMPNSAYRDVDEMATLLKAYPNAKIDIHGYIDTNESEACNESYCEGANLSTVRARCLYRKLLDRGISANQMTFKGMGTKAGKKIEIFIQNR